SAAVYLDSAARSALRMALALPNALDDLTALTESVIAAVQKTKMEEISRYDAMLKDLLDPKLLWRELNTNPSAFTADVQFDGGFKMSALIAAGRTEDNFTGQDVFVFGRAIRDMRNALSHGREQKSGMTISPTITNSHLLQPWIGPVRMAASQVILYK